MSFEHDSVKPTAFEAAEPQQRSAAAPPQADTNNGNTTTLAALFALLVLAAVVVLWLPGQFDSDKAGTMPVATASNKPPVAIKPDAPDSPQANEQTNNHTDNQQQANAPPPFAKAREARLRQNTQKVLSPMLDAQFELREQGVERWAPVPFNKAGELAVAGDLLYRDRQFEAAQEKYQTALEAFRVIQATVPSVLAEHIARTRSAIEEGDAISGTEQLEIATMIAPQESSLASLEQRLAQIPAIADLTSTAIQAERNGDLKAAVNALEQAQQLDGNHLRVQAELARLRTSLRSQTFNQAMSNGYAALSQKRFIDARKTFRQADSLSSGSPEAANALREVDERETAYRLQQLAQQGEVAQNAEDWDRAVSIYEKAVELDKTVLFATQGLDRSRPRAKLAAQLNTLLTEPQRLEDLKVAETARQLLAQGREVSGTAPLLEAQLQQLDALLVKASTPVKVLLRSDEQTEVTVHSVARLGRFDRHNLALRPGTYTAVGSRRGYRDVRQQFRVSHDTPSQEITIACREPI